MAMLNLADTLEALETKGIAKRTEHLEDLRHILDHILENGSTESLNDATFQRILSTLCTVISADHIAHQNARSTTSKPPTANKLTAVASTLRHVIGISLQTLKTKSVRFVLQHLLEYIDIDNVIGSTAFVSDIAKSLSILLSYDLHVEHLTQDLWQQALSTCLRHIQEVEHVDDFTSSNNSDRSQALTTRTGPQRSTIDRKQQSQSTTILEPMVECLRFLTSARNMDLSSTASILCLSLTKLLRLVTASSKVYEDAFGAVNNVVAWASVEDIRLVQTSAARLLFVIRKHWLARISSLKDEILVLLIYLQPFIHHAGRPSTDQSLQIELKALYDTLHGDYSQSTAREQLQLEHVVLSLQNNRYRDGCIGNSCFQLREIQTQPERYQTQQSWVVINQLAQLVCNVTYGRQEHVQNGLDEDDMDGVRSRKRVRLTDNFDELLAQLTDVSLPRVIASLQILAVMVRLPSISVQIRQQVLDELVMHCADDRPVVASWALIAAASNVMDNEHSQAGRTATRTIWKLAIRLMSNPLTSRAACHFINVVLNQRLVSQADMSELVQQLTTSLDLSGPSILAEASLGLLRTALTIARSTQAFLAPELGQRLALWFTRKWVPSKLGHRVQRASPDMFEMSDIFEFTACLVGMDVSDQVPPTLPSWSRVGCALINVDTSKDILHYLLLQQPSDGRDIPADNPSAPQSVTQLPDQSVQVTIFGHLIDEISSMHASFQDMFEASPRSLTTEIFKLYCSACYVSLLLSYNVSTGNIQHTEKARQTSISLLSAITACLSQKACLQNVVDWMLRLGHGIIFNRDHSGTIVMPSHRQEVLMIAQSIHDVLSARAEQEGRSQNNLQSLRTADLSDSQLSHPASQLPSTLPMTTINLTDGDTSSWRYLITFYAAIIVRLGSTKPASYGATVLSSFITEEIKNAPENSIPIVLRSLSHDLLPIVALAPTDVEVILEVCSQIVTLYTHNRSETTLSCIADFMSATVTTWTDPEHDSLYKLGLDLYEWLIRLSLIENVCSAYTQQRISALLLVLCEQAPDYGSDSTISSPRTSLFTLLRSSPVSVQFYLGPRVPTLFTLYAVARHDEIFQDVRKSLPEEMTWLEGIAMRLYILGELGSSLHSLLRQCVYYIFETAGQIPLAAPYATRCIARLQTSLALDSSTQVFALFSPQLLYTWLGGHNIRTLPSEVFNYTSTQEFLIHNKEEITAQLFLHNKDDDLEYVAREIGINVSQLLQEAFDRVFAYALSWDITNSTQGDSSESREGHLRMIVGGKDKLKKLIRDNHGAIVGRLLLAINREDSEEKWLEKTDVYQPAAIALADIKDYSQSTTPLPSSQQPHFRGKYLTDQLGRLARRLGHASAADTWDTAAYMLATQMLFDTMNEALGPLHSCLILQRQRLLIALAGHSPLQGYALETTLRLLLPYVDQQQCAGDAIGIFHYLLQHGITHLAQAPSFVWSIVTHVVLKLSQYEAESQHAATQTSQQRETLLKVRKFRSWLLTYLANAKTSLNGSMQEDATILVDCLTQGSLPGNCTSDSPESTLLLLLLRYRISAKGLLDQQQADQALTVLTRGFVRSTEDDCLLDIAKARTYAQSLWQVSQLPSMDDTFMLWSAVVTSRVYAATGDISIFKPSSRSTKLSSKPEDSVDGTRSHKLIADRIIVLSQSTSPTDVSMALSTLRACLRRLQPIELNSFQKLFPLELLESVEHIDSKYHRHSLTTSVPAPPGKELKNALALTVEGFLSEWMKNIAASVCALSGKYSFVRGLDLILSNDNVTMQLLLPSVVHLVLLEHSTSPHILKQPLSESLKAFFSSQDEQYQSRQRILVDLVLYLLQRPYPVESTLMDRMAWIDCDYLAAADCASRCQMPEAALMLLELARSQSKPRKAGSRHTVACTELDVPPMLLLDIFQHVDEPDSYYGVEQPASLQSLLDRVEYEGDALQTLTSVSAKLGSRMVRRQSLEGDVDMLNSLSAMNLDSLVQTLSRTSGMAVSPRVALDTARVLRQWDIGIVTGEDTSSSLLYQAFRVLSHATETTACASALHQILLSHVKLFQNNARTSSEWIGSLASISELLQTIAHPATLGLPNIYDTTASQNSWMETAELSSFQNLVHGRGNIAGVLASNKRMLEGLHVSYDVARQSEAGAMIMLSKLARLQDQRGLAESMSWLLQDYANSASQLSSPMTTLAKQEIASVLWKLGDGTASITMLQELVAASQEDKSTMQAVILSQIGSQLAEARLERPSDVLEKYLRPAINRLETQTGDEAGQVFHTFATFCDAQLQSSDSIDDYNRISKLRQAKLDEVDQLKIMVAAFKKTDTARKVPSRNLERAKQWFAIDDEEYQRLKRSREVFAEQSLKNYMLTLSATDRYDISVLRLFALWLEYAENEQTQVVIKEGLGKVPTWKFVVLMNQLMSRLKGDKSELDQTLLTLLMSVCQDHPYHTVHHLYAARKFPGKDAASEARRDTAERLCRALGQLQDKGDVISRMLQVNSLYRVLAEEHNGGRQSGKYSIKDSTAASKVSSYVPRKLVPPATIELPLQPDGKYEDVPVVTSISQTMTIMTGLSTPKVLVVYASNGKQYRQLFKGGNDDLRQDAIMEQVFSEVSKMLRNHKASRRRDLHVRTYKVIPLTNRSGIIEFVPNSLPINDFLQPAHTKYYPSSLRHSTARQRISAVQDQSREVRVKEFRKICDQMPPVLRYFFFERFHDPDEWFRNRTAYTRSTATISMLGHILGLGDRHCHNILLDEHNGEVIHIDLGVAFEAGRVLPIPELVPFRLTRDIVDGMGITGVEGTFKRCAEITLDALRKDKDGIMTLLNVLRYDPLYSWTLSPVKAKQMQQQNSEANETGANAHLVTSKTTESEAGEAERALSIVEKKLGNALSTAASVSELIQQATDERNLATLFNGWAAFF